MPPAALPQAPPLAPAPPFPAPPPVPEVTAATFPTATAPTAGCQVFPLTETPSPCRFGLWRMLPFFPPEVLRKSYPEVISPHLFAELCKYNFLGSVSCVIFPFTYACLKTIRVSPPHTHTLSPNNMFTPNICSDISETTDERYELEKENFPQL